MRAGGHSTNAAMLAELDFSQFFTERRRRRRTRFVVRGRGTFGLANRRGRTVAASVAVWRPKTAEGEWQRLQRIPASCTKRQKEGRRHVKAHPGGRR